MAFLCDSTEAAKILSNHSHKPISKEYVRVLARIGKLRRVKIHNSMSLYLRKEVEGYIVKRRGGRKEGTKNTPK
jgi:hypothetical protein